MKQLLIITFCFLGALTVTGQHKDHEGHDHSEDEHMHHDHKHHDHKHEIGMANSPVYFFKEKELSYGFHIHYIYSPQGKFGIGVGYERIFDEHKHHTIGIVGSYRITDRWSINLAPGITFEESFSNEKNFAAHLESAYEFELGNMHLGPAFEIAYDPEDIHVSIGLHLGFGF